MYLVFTARACLFVTSFFANASDILSVQGTLREGYLTVTAVVPSSLIIDVIFAGA